MGHPVRERGQTIISVRKVKTAFVSFISFSEQSHSLPVFTAADRTAPSEAVFWSAHRGNGGPVCFNRNNILFLQGEGPPPPTTGNKCKLPALTSVWGALTNEMWNYYIFFFLRCILFQQMHRLRPSLVIWTRIRTLCSTNKFQHLHLKKVTTGSRCLK